MNYLGTIWTIGHSTHKTDEFVSMLQSFQIVLLVDIRSLPGSRRFPHFNKEFLEMSLPKYGIQYIHLKELGGRRKVKPDTKNTGWRLQAFRGYADYMETEEFENAVKKLEQLAIVQKTAYMCSEAVWWRCHRGLVSDWLKVHNWQVMHIMNKQKAEEHPYTRVARFVDGKLSYDAEEKVNVSQSRSDNE